MEKKRGIIVFSSIINISLEIWLKVDTCLKGYSVGYRMQHECSRSSPHGSGGLSNYHLGGRSWLTFISFCQHAAVSPTLGFKWVLSVVLKGFSASNYHWEMLTVLGCMECSGVLFIYCLTIVVTAIAKRPLMVVAVKQAT